jgi:hypothetical protein
MFNSMIQSWKGVEQNLPQFFFPKMSTVNRVRDL